MGLFNFSQDEILTFMAVLIRFSTLMMVLPFLGDRLIPSPIKVLLSFSITLALFPALVKNQTIQPGDALVWGATTSGIVMTMAFEAICGLVLGFTSRFVFEAIMMGSNLAGNFMGFASASMYDPHQESQTHVVSEVYMAMAMLLFLVLNGHHLMLQASLDSYSIVGMGKAGLSGALNQHFIELSGEVLKFSLAIAAPVGIAIFGVNVFFGVVAKAMPQVNILVLSFAVTTSVGLAVMFFSVSEFSELSQSIMGQMGEWLRHSLYAMRAGV